MNLAPGLNSRDDTLNVEHRYHLSIYYGWAVLVASALTEMVALGVTSYAAGLYVIPLERELSLSRGAANSSIAILFGGGILLAPLVGRLLDRYSARSVMVYGALALSAAFAAIASTSSVAVMAVVLFAPGAFGFIAIGSLTTSTLASRWFYRRRGLALGIATVATSGGGFVVVPLLSVAIASYGWRTTLFLEALLISIIVSVLVLLVIRNNPVDLGLQNHPENCGRPGADLVPQKIVGGRRSANPFSRWSEILSSRNFWTIVIAPASVSALSQAIVITLAPYGAGLGFGTASSALLISAFSVAAAVTKVTSGFLADRFDRRFIMMLTSLSMAASFTLLLSSVSFSAVLTSACLAGIALGGVLPSSALLIASYFGAPAFGAVMGLGYAITGLFTILAVRFVGAMFDHAGNYRTAFFTFAALSAAVAFAPLMARSSPAKVLAPRNGVSAIQATEPGSD
jgi:sugar phosphate permease